MNARILRRVFLPLGMAALVSGAVYGLTGISSAASAPKLARPAVVHVVSTMYNKAGKIMWRKTGVAKITRLAPAAARPAGAAAPEATSTGPDYVCLADAYVNYAAEGGAIYTEEFEFGSSPFVIGSMFNQTVPNLFAFETEYQSGDDVYVRVLQDAGSYPGAITGYLGVDTFC
jgi:hypothetical protein